MTFCAYQPDQEFPFYRNGDPIRHATYCSLSPFYLKLRLTNLLPNQLGCAWRLGLCYVIGELAEKHEIAIKGSI
jgi:hypothetical protein